VVLRFEHDQVQDVGSEFLPYFDQQIATVRERLDARDLEGFKSSDGKLAPAVALPPETMHRLRKAKIGILEIVWSYLYSGREREAWSALADMWPSTDLDRIRMAIVKMRARGIHAQTDADARVAPRRKKRATIFDVTRAEEAKSEVIPPQPILLRRPAPLALGQEANTAEVILDLTVDSAGKVRSVEPAGNAKSVDSDLITAALRWKFIPALSGGHAVASRMRFAVSARK